MDGFSEQDFAAVDAETVYSTDSEDIINSFVRRQLQYDQDGNL